MSKVMILGSGSFGTALAVAIAQNGHQVVLWGWQPEFQALLRQQGENRQYLPGVMLPPQVQVVDDLAELGTADFVLLAVPTVGMRSTAARLRGKMRPDAVVITVAKGLEPESLLRMSQVVQQENPGYADVALSGPSHAEEVSRGMPTAIVAASSCRQNSERVQDLFAGSHVRVYLNDDQVGVELGGALKNIIAFAAGIADGIGLGDNPKAALMTRGITEIARLGVAMGARAETFTGLSGVGDLIVTCTSMHSRNRRAGILLGQGKSAQQAVKEVGMVVEGIIAARCAQALARQVGVEMPITQQVCQVLDGAITPQQAITGLMARPLRHEREESWPGQPE